MMLDRVQAACITAWNGGLPTYKSSDIISILELSPSTSHGPVIPGQHALMPFQQGLQGSPNSHNGAR